MGGQVRKADARIATDTAKALGLSPSELSKELGYSAGAMGEWTRAGQMPVVAALACEGLRRRHRASEEERRVVVLDVTAEELSVITPLLDRLGVHWRRV